jgi:hypothetical protein
VRCPRCGNENSEENRFCGMCGAKLLAATAAVASTPVAVAASSAATRSSTSPSPPAPVPARPQVVAPLRPSAPMSQASPGISGPSFLGLNDPPPRTRGSLSADPHSSSSNLDYLLEDEEPKRGGAGRFALILLMLALAGGFGYMRWKWLQAGQSKRPAATTSQTPDPAATTYVLPASGNANDTSAPPTPAPAQPATPAPQPTPDASSANTPAAGNAAAAPAAGSEPSAKTDAPAPSDAPNSSPDPSATSEPAAKEPAAEPAAAEADTPAAAPAPKRPATEPQPKPHAGITSSRSADAVSEAQKYIYGRGVTQDCERGMRLLKPAAAQANPKAMIEMGALYSAGLCTPHDLPTAYRWFAMALRKDPENQSVQADLQKVWGEMTQPERQLAIRLSQ